LLGLWGANKEREKRMNAQRASWNHFQSPLSPNLTPMPFTKEKRERVVLEVYLRLRRMIAAVATEIAMTTAAVIYAVDAVLFAVDVDV
jgi:hypothetical protein